jgi:glutaredoxin
MLTVYGADWCEDTQRSLRHLRRLRINHQYENVDKDPVSLERAKELNDGKRRTPTVHVDGNILVEPTNAELTSTLVERGLIGLSEARERLRTHNVGDLERVLRVAGGLAVLGYAARMRTPWKWPLAAWGVFEAVSGAVGSCPVYRLAGRTSTAGPGDHPREAERRAWLAPVQ